MTDFCSLCQASESGAYCPVHGIVRRPFSIADRYDVDELIGIGPRSLVFGGRSRELAASVAIKVLRPHIAADLAVRQRFVREAGALSMLVHAHVVRVLDAGWDEALGAAYVVMEREAGQVADVMVKQSGPLPWSAAVPLLVQICRAVSAAHVCGINDGHFTAKKVFVTDHGDGRVARLCNFGVSSTASSAGGTSSDDVYGIGTVAHELITGRLPLEGSSPAGTLSDDPIRVNERFPHLAIPDALDDLIRMCRLRDPLLRPSVDEIEASLLSLDVPSSAQSLVSPNDTSRIQREVESDLAAETETETETDDEDVEATAVVDSLSLIAIADAHATQRSNVQHVPVVELAYAETTSFASVPAAGAYDAAAMPSVIGMYSDSSSGAPAAVLAIGSQPAPIPAAWPGSFEAAATMPDMMAVDPMGEFAPALRDSHTIVSAAAVDRTGIIAPPRRSALRWAALAIGGGAVAAAAIAAFGLSARSVDGARPPVRRMPVQPSTASQPIAPPRAAAAPPAASAQGVAAAESGGGTAAVPAPSAASDDDLISIEQDEGDPASSARGAGTKVRGAAAGGANAAARVDRGGSALINERDAAGHGSARARARKPLDKPDKPDKKDDPGDVLIVDPFSHGN